MAWPGSPAALGLCTPACEITSAAGAFTLGVSLAAATVLTVDGVPVRVAPASDEVTWLFSQRATVVAGQRLDVPITAHVAAGQTPPTATTLSLNTNLVFLSGHPDCSNLPLDRACEIGLTDGVGTVSVATHGGSLGNALLSFPADPGIFPGNTWISVDVVSFVPARHSPTPRSSSATADPLVAGGPARNLAVNVGSAERTRVTVTLPGWFALPGHRTCGSSPGSERGCVVTIASGGSGTRRIAAGPEVGAGTHDIAAGVGDRPRPPRW